MSNTIFYTVFHLEALIILKPHGVLFSFAFSDFSRMCLGVVVFVFMVLGFASYPKSEACNVMG